MSQNLRGSRIKTSKYFATVVLLLCAWPLAAAPALLRGSENPLRLDAALEQLPERESPWTLDQVRSEPLSGEFVSNTKATINHGFNTPPHWYRTTLRNDRPVESGERQWLLEFAYPLLDTIDVYVLRQDGRVEAMQTGDRREPDPAQLPHRNLVLPLRLDPGDEVQIYFRVQTESTHLINLWIWPPAKFAAYSSVESLWYGLYFGLMLGLALYNFFILLSVRDVAYVYHVLYILSMAALQLDLHGFSRQ